MTKAKPLIKQKFSYDETKGIMITDTQKALDKATLAIKKHRKQLEDYLEHNPIFLCSLTPIHIDDGPIVVRRMAEASAKAGVGPMAAVAGVLADLAVENMILNGTKVAIVENGGEISANSVVPIDVALSAGYSVLSKNMGFRLEKFPIGIGTSSGKFSHALSFGEAEAVTVFACNSGLADATATAVGNVVKGNDQDGAIKRGIEKAMSIEGVTGIFIIYQEKVGHAGKIPRIISIKNTK